MTSHLEGMAIAFFAICGFALYLIFGAILADLLSTRKTNNARISR